MLAPKNNKAFSLVELMVVIAIIGILSAIAVPSYKSYIIKSRIASMIPTLESGINIAMQYYDINGTFPNPLTVYGNSMPMPSVASVNIQPATYAWYGGAFGSLGSAVQLCLLFSDIG